jgi:two-component system, NtrC family, response regulator HydG
MDLDDLDLRDLFEMPPTGGVLRFAGERALIMDAVALGLLRRTLIETVGVAGARSILIRFGYAHGQRTAEVMRDAFPWGSERAWQLAGGRLHKLWGLVVPETLPERPGGPFVEALWHDSYEAEQHLLHLGRADQAACWAQCGFVSGYLSRVNQAPIYCVETRCRARGDAVCHMVGQPRDAWGDAIGDIVAPYEQAGLDAALAHASRALRRTERTLRTRTAELARTFRVEPSATGLVAASAAMARVIELARRVARVDSTALIVGESGVGKERVARLIHDESARAARALVAINCAALPDPLLESELFGHQRGAFTGAIQDRPGLFEQASGGTLFLDEIGEISPAMQVALLRVLQERELRRIGETRVRRVDVRVIAATNRDLAASVRAGTFRQDLYYRLRVVEIEVPPLRARPDDIAPLARELLAAAAERARSAITGFTPRAVDALARYPWPGNVRELANAIERAVVLATGDRIDVADLPRDVAGVDAAHRADDHRTLADVERDHLLAVLAAHGGHRARAAAALGISPATLYRKLAAYAART